MESCSTSKVLSNRAKLNRLALCEVSNTQKSKEAEVIKRWLQYGTRDSSSSKEDVNSVIEESEKDSTTQETVIFNGTREINIPTPRKVVSPTKVPWYQLPRVVIPIVTPPEVTVSKPNLEIMKSNQSSLTTIKRNSKKSKKSQPNNNNSLLNWFGPSTSSNGQQSESDKPFDSQNDSSSSNSALDGNRNSEEICNSQQNESRPIASIGKKRSQGLDIKVAPLPDLENVDLGKIDMNLITDIVRLYDFIIKFEKPLELDLEYNGDKLKYADLEEMILDTRFHTRLAFLQSGLLYFLCKESEVELDIDLVNLQYYLVERYPNKEFLREKEYSEFSSRERMSIFIDFINEALHTNKLREFIKELTIPANHKKENFIRTERKKEIKFKINEIRVMIVNKENEIKNIETQLTKGFESETINLDLPNAVTKRQKSVAKRKMEQEFNERKKDAADEIEILLQRIDKLEMEHKELDMLNKTERDHANCTLRGGSILNPSGRDERFYLIVKLGQDRDGKYYWFFRELGGVFVETIKWNYPEQDVDNSSLPLTSSSEWQFIGGIGIFRMLMTVLNTRDNKEKLLKTNLQMLEKEIEPTFDSLNLWMDKKRDVKAEKMEVDSEEVKSIMSQRQKSFWKLFDTVIRKKNVWSLEEYHIIMGEYVKRKIAELEKILRLVDPNLVFKDFQSSGINASDFVNEVKNMISETGFKFTSTVHASKTKKNKSWDWLYDVASKWYSLDIKTFSILASWLDVMIEAGEPIVRSIKKRMQEQLTEKYKRPTRLRDRKNKVVVYKEESLDDDVDEVDEIEKDDDVEEHKQPSKWSLRERKRVAYNN